jgi:sigma-54 specific flagellar transcriptional regulator A
MDVRLSGYGEKITRIKSLINQVARVNISVLITGASGTGKEVVARLIHENSTRKDMPFIPVNCAAIPSDLLESELFGHEKGSFSGAYNTRIGRFEMAGEGTIFLDEIGDMPLPMQSKLLRVIQEKTFERIGSNVSLKSKARIVAATHQNLESLIKNGLFREDLYYRLNVFPIEMPSLKERSEDFRFIVDELIEQIQERLNLTLELDESAYLKLEQNQWPGNIRELSNLIERLMVMYPNKLVTAKELPERYKNTVNMDSSRISQMTDTVMTKLDANTDEKLDLREVLKNIEINYIHEALEKNNWVVSHAADDLTLRRTTLIEKIKKYNLNK